MNEQNIQRKHIARREDRKKERRYEGRLEGSKEGRKEGGNKLRKRRNEAEHV
jgi:hypothetical protein